MKQVVVLACMGLGLMLSACTSPAERQAALEAQKRRDMQECERLGFKEGSEAMGGCVLKLREIRAQERAAMRPYYDGPRFGMSVGSWSHF